MDLPRSKILDTLAPDLFVPFSAVQIPGRVIWCNFELARELGFDVPESNEMNSKLHEELIRAFSYRALKPGEKTDGRPTITLYADRYGGDGVFPSLGSARGGFLPYCNAFLKGLGLTPLHRHSDRKDFEHSHGGLNMYDAVVEAVFGEINMNLFEGKTARVLAIIDQQDDTVYPNWRKIPRAIEVRVGDQLRPGHLLAKACWKRSSRLEAFLAITRETGQLVTGRSKESGKEVPDLRATMLQIIDDHALIAAQQVRWRIVHRFLSTSNMRMDGGMLDLNTQRANPRLAPVRPDHSLDSEKIPNSDYLDRTQQMLWLYQAVRGSIPAHERKRYNAEPIRITTEMDREYLKHLAQQLLCVAGLKAGLARHILAEHPEAGRHFLEVLFRMTEIKNPAGLQASRELLFQVAVLDIFHLLSVYPEEYFRDPGGRPVSFVRNALRAHYKGSQRHVARKRAAVEALIPEFINAYHQLMEICRSLAEEYYGSETTMQASIQSRAAFENRPMSLLFREACVHALRDAASAYRIDGDADRFREVIDNRAAASLRNVEAILRGGQSRILANGVLELQIQVIHGVRYAVRIRKDGAQKNCLHVSTLRGETNGPGRIRKNRIPEQSGAEWRYKFTLDDWATACEVIAHTEWDESSPVLSASIYTPCTIGELQGYFFKTEQKDLVREKDQGRHSRYVFAVPDAVDLASLFGSKA